MAPIVQRIVPKHDVQGAFLILAAMIAPILLASCYFIVNPPKDYDAKAYFPYRGKEGGQDGEAVLSRDYPWKKVVRCPSFYRLAYFYFCGCLSCLMLSGHIAGIAYLQAGVNHGAFLVSIITAAYFAASLISGIGADRISPKRIFLLAFTLQTCNLFAFALYDNVLMLALGCVISGFLYGTVMTVVPMTASRFFGIAHFGRNFGAMVAFSCIGAFSGPMLASYFVDNFGSYWPAFLIAGAFLVPACISSARLSEP